MKIEDIKESAPKGATHYSETPMEYIYLRFYLGGWQCFCLGDWFSYSPEHDEILKPL